MVNQNSRQGPQHRRWVAVATLAASVLLLTACASSSGSSSTAKAAGTNITFMEAMSSGKLKTTIDSLVSQFEKSHPGLTVTLIPQPSYGVLAQKEQASVAAGNAPTIGQAYENWAASYAASNAIVPLDSYVNGTDGISATQQASIWPNVLADLRLPDGKMWMWPFNKSDYVMYYNSAMMSSKHQSVPTTWAQWASTAKAVTHGGQWGVSMDPGTAAFPSNGTYLFQAMIQGYGGAVVTNGKPSLNTPAAAQALSLLVSMEKAGALKVGTNYPGQTALGAGKSLFDMSTVASYYYNEQAVGNKFPMGVAAFPAGPVAPGNVMQGTNIVMFAGASPAQRTAAWTFMKWLTEPTQAAFWAEGTGYLPISKDALALMSSYITTHPYVTIASQSLATATSTPPYSWFTQEAGAMSTALQSVLIGHSSVTAALTKAQATALAAANGG